nr:DUF3006 domain-containing protein [Alkaliphilus hydrothermalis]
MKKSISTVGIIDRFEGNFAVVEYGERQHFDLPKDMLPKEAVEGDSIKIVISIDEEETEKRKQEIEALTKRLFKDE